MVGSSFLGALSFLTVGRGAFATTLVAIEEPSCSLDAVSPWMTGMTPRTGVGFSVVDRTNDEVYTVASDCTQPVASFDTAVFGATDPTGIAWDGSLSHFAIVDSVDDKVYIRDAEGLSVGQCHLANIGATDATGIAYNNRTGQYAVVDATQDKVYVIDDDQLLAGPCTFVSQFSTTTFGSTSPGDIGYNPTTDQYIIYDTVTNDVSFVTTAGVLVDVMDASEVVAATGMAYDLVSQRLYMAGGVNYHMTLVPVDTRGTMSVMCSTSAQLSADSTGIAANTATGNIVYVDSSDDQINVVNPLTCATVAQLSIGPAGATSATDIAYVDVSNEYVVADTSSGDRLFFFDAPTGVLTSQCTLPFNIELSGVDYLPDLDLLAITSAGDEGTWLLSDMSCAPIHVRGVGMYIGVSTINDHANDIAYHRGTGTFLIPDENTDDVAVLDFEGAELRHFDLGGSGLSSAVGMVAIPGDQDGFYVVDRGRDEIWRIDVPALAETGSIAGRFASASTTVYLWDRGEGKVTGTALLGGNTLPVFGEFDGSAGSLAIGAVTPAGGVVAFPITVSADLNTINAPPPIGVLRRSF